ncbi:MAG: hypothetical protein NT000_04080 [Proteobacteria bacterium]|nr:hypothetical protein [Pseudomonadota bacterium]
MEAPKVILTKLLEQHEAQEYKLPVLKPPLDFIGSFIHQVFNWIGSLFQFPALGDLRIFSLNVFTLIAYALFFGLVGVLIWGLYKALRPGYLNSPNAFGSLEPDITPLDEIETLSTFINLAIVEKDFARAARLRWRLFLLRRKLPDSKTLLEIFPEPSANTLYYSLMFRQEHSTGTHYESFDRWVSEREIRLG